MRKLYILAAVLIFFGCSESNLIIDPAISKSIAEKLDTIYAIKDYNESDIDLKDLFNSDLLVSYNNSGYKNTFSNGGISIDSAGNITINYHLSESSGPNFTIKINKFNKIISGKYIFVGDDSPNSSQVDIEIKKIIFSRVPIIGKSLCFFMEFYANNWSFPKGEKQNSYLKIYGFTNEVKNKSED
jgi:hypothetical protein